MLQFEIIIYLLALFETSKSTLWAGTFAVERVTCIGGRKEGGVFLKNLLAIMALCYEVCARKSDAWRVFDHEQNDDETIHWAAVYVQRPNVGIKEFDSNYREKTVSGL